MNILHTKSGGESVDTDSRETVGDLVWKVSSMALFLALAGPFAYFIYANWDLIRMAWK
jgi:hypothetical protein